MKFNVESALTSAGANLVAAKASIEKLDAAFMGEAGDIPTPVLEQWAGEHFPPHVVRAFFVALGKAWEGDHAATLPKEREWERSPEAAEIKAKLNEEKAAPKTDLPAQVAALTDIVAKLTAKLEEKVAK